MCRSHLGRRQRHALGLTVIEMMVAVAVVAVLAALAAPSLLDFLARQRVAAVNAELVTDLKFARSEAVARNREVYITFYTDPLAGSPPMTCYTIHTLGVVGSCDCRKPPGTACLSDAGNPVAEVLEIKTVQVLRSTKVSLMPPAWPADIIGFTGTRGYAFWSGHMPTDADYSTDWQDFQVGVESSISGALRTSVGITGKSQVCSPDGSITGAPRCP
jgi:prepilin-type N-terminal cleavage/methylation domain-containing protein